MHKQFGLTIRFELCKLVPALVLEMILRNIHGPLWKVDATIRTAPIFVCHIVWLRAFFSDRVDFAIRLPLCLSTLHCGSNDAVARALVIGTRG